jgi:hypothetical protein
MGREEAAPMDVATWLTDSADTVLADAYDALQRAHTHHYAAAGETFTRQRLRDLFDLVVSSIRDRDLASMSTYAQRIATERFEQGFDLAEVQTAFNSRPHAMWRRVVADAPPAELAEAVGLLRTVPGFGKDTLARTYVSLATRTHVPSLDLSALFAGPQEA